MDDTTDTLHVPHVMDASHDDPAFTAWLDAQEAKCLTRQRRDARRRTTPPERRHP